jgi:N-hydroxyarylamine O-acetyltransferase
MNVTGYLARLGVDRPAEPSVAALYALHRAHVERVPYETYDLYLRRPPGVVAASSAARVIAGRGGFCYHLNGAFSLLLRWLGFSVTWHLAGVQLHDQPAPGADGNHLAIIVHGLPSAESPTGKWLVDVGLGDGLYEPVPLRSGTFQQGPFEYRLRPSGVVPGGWRLDHDARGTFVGFDLATEPAVPADFTRMSTHLSCSPDSPFVRTPLAERRDATGVDLLVGCLLTRVDRAGRQETVVDRPDDWYHLLATRFGLTFSEFDTATRLELWRRVRHQHETYRAKLATAG